MVGVLPSIVYLTSAPGKTGEMPTVIDDCVYNPCGLLNCGCANTARGMSNVMIDERILII
jgi:hypothetical protein